MQLHLGMNEGLLQISPEWIHAGGVLGTFFLLALLVKLASLGLLRKILKRAHTSLEEMIFNSVKGLLTWALVLAGAYYSALEIDKVRKDQVLMPAIGHGFTIAWVILAAATAIRILGTYARWRITGVQSTGGEEIRDITTRVSFFRKLISVFVIGLAGVYILSVAGINTSPLVAGGAVGGIVIGIALQDTLSNIFAGFFLNIDRPVKIGDYIKLDSGQEGFVEDVGWRYTKVRLWANNLLVIPNNKLSQSIITNFNLPVNSVSVYVPCGVSYDSDLEHVEQVAHQVAKDIQSSVPGGDSTWEPLIRFKEFGDSSINFVVTLRSTTVASQYILQHEFVKALHRTFNKEGIEIPFPIRTLIMKPQDLPTAPADAAGSNT